MLGKTRASLINTTSVLVITLLSFVFLAATTARIPGNTHSVTHAESSMALPWQPPTFTEVKKLTPSPAPVQLTTIAVSDSTLVAGAGFASPAGADFVYQRIDGIGENWDAVKTLRLTNATPGDRFGWLIAIDGDMSVAGAAGDDIGRGAAYIFERNAGGADNWGRTKRLTAPQRHQNDEFGQSAAISGDTVVVGSNSAAYIFERNNGGLDNWGFVKKLDNDRAWLGVAIDGNTLVIGGGYSQNRVDIYQRNNGGANNWGKVKTLHPANATSRYGLSLAISGNTLVVGDFDPSSGYIGGSAYVYMRDQDGDNNWGLVKKLHASDSRPDDAFGYSVAIAGNTIVVGAGSGLLYYTADAAYVFKRNQGGADNWGEIQKLIGSDSPTDFGFRVATSGGRVFVCGGGGVYIFATPLDIAARSVSIDLGSAFTNTRIGRVQDANQPFNTLLVSVNDGTSATVNAVTVSNITVNANGGVFANVAAHFGATNADFTLKVTNSLGEIDTATLRVEITQP